MESIIQTIRQYLNDPFTELIVASIIGLLPTIIEKLQKKTNQIWWDSKSVFFQADNSEINNSVESFSICRLIFWNSGNETILNSNISSIEPLILYFGEEIEILEIHEISSSNPSIRFEVVSSNQIYISFEYLEGKEGAILEVVHTGESIRPHLAGKIIGGKINRKLMSPIEISISSTPKLYFLIGWLKPAQQVLFMRWVSTVFSIFTLWLVFSASSIIVPNPELRWYAWTVIISALFVYPIVAIWTWKIAIVPTKLRDFYLKIE